MSFDAFQPPREVNTLSGSLARPVGVTVFAILNLGFGLLGLFGILFTIVMAVWNPNFGGAPNPTFELMEDSVAYRVFFFGSMVLGAVFTLLLVVSGIGLFQMSAAARKMAIAYAIYSIISGIVGMVVNIFVIFLPMIEQVNLQGGPQRAVLIAGTIGGLVGTLLALVFPIAILIYFSRPKVKEAFRLANSTDS